MINDQPLTLGARSSFIDLTLVCSRMAKKRIAWEVLETENLSDHKYIWIEITDGTPMPLSTPQADSNKVRWNYKKLDKITAIHMWQLVEQAEEIWPHDLDDTLRMICEGTMPQRKNNKRRKEVYWWTNDIAAARKKCIKARRLYNRAKRTEDEETKHQEYKECKNQLKKLIKVSKAKMWEKTIEELNADQWGRGYQIVNKDR